MGSIVESDDKIVKKTDLAKQASVREPIGKTRDDLNKISTYDEFDPMVKEITFWTANHTT